VTELTVAASVCGHAASQLRATADPQLVREAAMEVSAELADVAAALRRLTRPRAAERRALARKLDALGVPRAEIARRLGLSYAAAWKILR
jgi:hypothetical protein